MPRYLTLICQYESCRQPFQVKAYRASSARFCSHACYAKTLSPLLKGRGSLPKITLSCAYEPCGKLFEVHLCRRDKARFCSIACHNRANIASRWTATLEERFWAKVATGSPDECWMWTGHRNKAGYGKIWVPEHRRPMLAPVVAWFLHAHIWPTFPLHVLHNCPTGDDPACVNIAHLWLGTQQDNMRDMVTKGRHKGFLKHSTKET